MIRLAVCQDCALARENGDTSSLTPERAAELWRLLPDDDVTLGLPDHMHTCEDVDTCRESGEGCEFDTFSTTPCAACGDHLAGYRFAYTLHTKETP